MLLLPLLSACTFVVSHCRAMCMLLSRTSHVSCMAIAMLQALRPDFAAARDSVGALSHTSRILLHAKGTSSIHAGLAACAKIKRMPLPSPSSCCHGDSISPVTRGCARLRRAAKLAGRMWLVQYALLWLQYSTAELEAVAAMISDCVCLPVHLGRILEPSC